MADSATIVAASLDSSKLEESINKLVATVASKTKEMADNFTSEVARMEQAVKNLGSIKIDSGGTADGGSSKRTSSLKQEEQQVKSVATSYDGLAKAQQTAIGSRGGSALRKDIDEAANSYSGLIQQIERTQAKFDISPIQNLRMRQHELEAGMQTAANEAAKAKKDVDELNAAITNYRSTLETLPKNGQGFSNRQAIQKEINDLIVLRDTASAEQQKWENAGRQLAAQYESVKGEIKQIGQELIDSEKTEKQVTSELDKQLQKIKEINSSKSAKAAYESISSMPTNTIDQVEVKLQALQALKEKVANTPLLSKSSQSQLTQAITDTKGRIEQIEMAARGTNQSKKSLDELNAAIIQNIRREEERRNAILQTGIAAQEAFAKIRQSAQIQLADNTDKPIMGVKELTEAIRNMRQAYYGMNVSERESPLGQSLQRDIENAQKLRTAIEAYNKTLLGLPVIRDKSGIDKTLGSYTELSALLKTLSDEYRHLGREERNAAKGNDLADKIQRLGRETQKIQQQMNRPISFAAAMKGDEKTLDDIAYKMRQLASYRSGLNVATQTKEITQVNDEYNRLKKRMDEVMQKNQQMIASNTALGRSWNYMKNRLAFYFTVGASTQFVKNLIEVRSQYEMNEKALGILLDSASRGTRIFNELSQMSLVSPYTLIELSNAAKQLTAYDIAAKDVVDTTRRLADMASAVGVPIERLTYALGQIKAYGYLNSRDARMFANAGIPLVKQLADRYSELEGKMVSTADVYDRMKKKAIDYNDVMAVINKMTDEGGKFFDFQAKMAETLKVRLANLTLAWNNMLNDMGKDNQGVMTTGLKGLTLMFKHWREIYRVISTAIVALGAYRVATILAGMATKSSIGGSAVVSWFSLAKGINSAKDAAALFSLTLKSIPFTAWVTAIATLASYFILFNNSSDDVKQKLEDIKSAFDGVRKEVETLFADAIKTDNIGTQLTKLRDMLELAETELGVTIPIRLEDVNESNIKQKLKEAKQFVDEYINFSQTFSEAAAGTKFNELMNDFGSKARSTYTNVTESINSVIVALQELSDKGQASKRDIEILNELTSGQKEDESRIEYLQRLISLYEELGLIGQKKVEPMIEHNFFKAYFSSTWDNMEELEQKQEENLDRLGIKNKSVFENMLKDVQEYYSSSSIAAYQLEQQVMRVAEKIDINNIPVEQRTMKLTAAINEEASQNNWNQFEKEFARQVANKKFGTNIIISDDSKKSTETELQEWQKKQQKWMDDHGIKVTLTFQTNDTEVSYEKRMLQEAKDAAEEYQTQLRKLERGTGSQDAVDKALKSKNEARQRYFAAGGDMSLLDKKENAARKKAIKEAESELQKALKDELSTIDKVRSIYKDLTKEGMSHADAVARATSGWDETVNAINKVLQKNGLKKLNLADFVGIDNPRDILKTLQAQLEEMVKRGASASEIKVIQEKIRTLEVDADKYDLTKITKGLNNELDRLKEEYELAIALDADPELGDIFADFMGIDKKKLAELPRSYNQLLSMLQGKIDTLFKENDIALNFDLSKMINKEKFDKWVKDNGHTLEDGMAKSLNAIREYLYKILNEETKHLSELVSKYGDAHARIEKIYATTSRNVLSVISTYGNNEDREKAIDLSDKIAIEDSPEVVARLRNELNSLGEKVAEGNDAAQTMFDAIFKNQGEEIGKTLWDNFKGGDYYSVIFDDLSRASTSALQTMKAQLDVIKDKIKESPEAMKAFMSAYGKLRQELIERDPFRGIVDSLNDMRIAHQQVIISQASLDSSIENARAKENNLNKIREKEPRNIVAIYNAEKELSKAKKDVAEKTTKLIQAQNNETSAQASFKKAVKEVNGAINKLGDALKKIGETLDNTTGNVIKFIGDIFSFVTFVSESMQSVSSTAAKSIQAIEKASVILAIISAAIQLIQELNSIIPDSFDQYEKAAAKQAEINKLTDAIVQYQLAVLAARMEEENWFSSNSLKQLKNYYNIGSEALGNYNRKLLESQAIYQNEQSGGWLTKFAYWSSPGTWISKITGIQGEWADAIALLGSGMFGMEAQMGQLGIWLTEHGNKDLYDYAEGFTAAINNLRIETREKSSGFLGTGIGGHSQETEDLVEWMKRELGLDLFDEDFMINEEAYQVIMDKYADKLVGETKATLESLHELTEKWNEYVEQLQDYVDSLYSPLVNNMTDAMWEWYNEGKNALTSFKEYASETFKDIVSDMMKTIVLSNFADEYANDIKELYTNYAKGGISEENLIKSVALRTGEMMESFEENIPVLERLLGTASSVLGQYGITLKSAENIELSALQQGIQGITENTAGALEAITSGMSQQVYYQSTLLEQIRDAIIGSDSDIQLGVQGQILLQLQTSYQTQQAIQGILEGWSSPNGMSVRVQLES